jgi:DNA-binding NtrC family response regulator
MKGHASEKKYILAVDDDSDIVTLIEQMLRKHGFKASAFTNPPMALEHFTKNHNNCSLILSDIRTTDYSESICGYYLTIHRRNEKEWLCIREYT